MRSLTALFVLSIMVSCENYFERAIKLGKVETYSLLHQEKASYPGLGFEKDTTINIVHVYNPKDSIIHEMFIVNIEVDKEYLIDSLLNIEVYKTDTVRIFQVDSKPIQLDDNLFTFFLYGGFNEEEVDFFQNDKKINIDEDTSTYLNYGRVDKSFTDSIGVSVNNSIPIYSVINKEYNYLRLFLIADSTIQFNYSYYWDEY